jgi:signal transduction histidine kinase
MGHSLDAILCADPRNRGWPDLAAAMAARQPVDGLLCTIASGDHQSWWRLTARPLLAETGACLGYRGIAHDASDEHRRDVDLTAAREAAAQAESRKAQYMRAVSHELRTPLNAIVGFAELLGSDQAANLPDHVRSEYLRIIVDSTHRLQSLIKNVLDISRAERGALQLAEQDVDVAELAEVTVKLCQAMAEEADVTVVAHLPDGVEIRVDVARVKEVLAALIAAAIASSPAGACVEVSIDRPAGSGLRFIVFHRGAGLAASPFTRAFAPFHLFEPDSAEAFGGAIAMARRVAHLHGGDLAVEDVAGGGTRASFSIAAARVLPRRKVAHLANA